ncbi:hypothetical protein [Halospina sp. K52047b]|uniref:hypothetical protein n=1 Tax=Halospina sp. K52047b TaxID=2614160 RepID=UPI00124AB318|nr:hypothetical protein [Halospina sp. K52047b]KAA8985450.1 hypothetical protein F3089_01915 [Halospina sp. K52047b]
MRRSGTNGWISWKNNRLKDLESIPDVRDGLTYTERIILYVLQETQHEVNGRNVPTAMLYGRVVEYVNLTEAELHDYLNRLGVQSD